MGTPAVRSLEAQEKRALFLENLAENLTIVGAARLSNVSPTRVYQWMDEDPAFAEAVANCRELATQRLEQSLYERAVKHDTIGAIFLLKSLRPNTYRDNTPPTQQFNITALIDQRAQQLSTPSNQAPSSQAEPRSQKHAGNQVIDIPCGSVKSLDLTLSEDHED